MDYDLYKVYMQGIRPLIKLGSVMEEKRVEVLIPFVPVYNHGVRYATYIVVLTCL